jgi:hypothetical protein
MANLDNSLRNRLIPPSPNSSSGQSRQPCLQERNERILPPVPDTIPETEPLQTASLWATVCGDTQPATMPPKSGKATNPTRSVRGDKGMKGTQDEQAENPLSTPQSFAATSYAPSLASSVQTKDTTISQRSSKQVTPRDADFRDGVLEPRGIVIDGTAFSLPDPFVHFGTQHTPETKYKDLPGLENLHIWLENDSSLLQEISEEYHCMVQNNLCEAEFATYGKEKLFKGEPRRLEISEDRQWRTERMIELVAKPSSREKWEPPPVLQAHARHRAYQFDIRPDCSYWLSLRAFNKEWRDRVEEYVLVMYDRVTCPYFTVEFKRDDSGDLAAENQVAAAGALALYNRYLLRTASLRHSNLLWDEQKADDIRHYGATFGGSKFALWCLRPVLSETGDWLGCNMSRIFRSHCHTEPGARSFALWVNEIHAWGLRIHGPACMRDLKRSLHSTGVRVSDIGVSDT